MASQNVPDVATMKASGYQLPASPLMIFTGLLALLLSPFGVYSICIAAITDDICQIPEAPPRTKASLVSSYRHRSFLFTCRTGTVKYD
ncbi:benzoate membrane transport protein [Salmonella enterica subsp. arizonae]|uniref:Benzoate membrane transport protein n=1 Tax=Salmonella enterica subsp. arizonae TaxID=59203 RepID=A0A379TDN7_SALER|nr:benzoate membrane transport protein [Salmonella enterica subsp. arizonae]